MASKRVNKNKKVDPNHKVIAGVGVKLDAPDLQSAKTLEGLKKLEIFSSVKNSEQDAAYAELAQALALKEDEED